MSTMTSTPTETSVNAKAPMNAEHQENRPVSPRHSETSKARKPNADQKPTMTPEEAINQFEKKFSKPRRKGAPPLRRDLMAAAAKAGDIEGVLDHWYVDEGDRDLAYVMCYARDAMRSLAKRDPKHLVQYAFNRMLVSQVDLMMRVERRIHTEIAAYDKYRADSGLPTEVTSEWLPRLERIQETIQQTSKNMATTLHALSLAQDGTKLERKKGGNVVPMHPQNDAEYANTSAV